MKKVLSLALAVVLIVGLLPIGMLSASAAATTYTFADYTAGTQYAENEEHVLDDVITITTTQCHFTTELRIYSSSTHDGYAIIKSTNVITGFGFNAGNKVDTLNVYGLESDGTTWTLIEGVAITTTSFTDYTVTMPGTAAYTQLKLDVDGTNQVRVASMTITTASEGVEDTDPPADSTLTIPEATALGTSKDSNAYTTNKYYVTGVISSVANTTYGNMTIKDADGNSLYIYGTYDATGTTQYGSMTTQPVAGDTVKVYGIIGNYNGTAQMKNGWIVEHVVGEGVEDTDPPADSTLTIPEATALGTSKDSNAYTTNKYYVTGEISSVANTTYGNMTIKDADGNSLYIYGTYDATGTTQYGSMTTQPVAGDTVTVYGIIGNYNGAAQMKNGWITAHTPATDDGGDSGEDGGDAAEGETESLAITAVSGTLADDSLSISWEGTNFSFVNEKNESTTAIRTSDSDHFRAYAKSKIVISGKNGQKLAKIVITATSASYASNLANATLPDGVTATADSTVVTLTLDSAMDSVEITMGAQCRLNNVEVTYASTSGEDTVPVITGMTINEDSANYDASTKTFTITKDGALVVTLTGKNFDLLADMAYEDSPLAVVFEGCNQPVATESVGGNAVIVSDTELTMTFDYSLVEGDTSYIGPIGYSNDNATTIIDSGYTLAVKEYSRFTGAQITLGDTLDVAFFASIPDNEKVDSMQVEFTLDGNVTYAPIGTAVDGVYSFVLEVPAKNMTTYITARLIDGDGNEYTTKEYSVRDYADHILVYSNEDDYTAAERAATKAMLNYGAYAQIYFGYDVENLANAEYDWSEDITFGYTEDELNAADVSGVASMSIENGLDSFLGASLVLKSQTKIRLYFSTEVTGSVAGNNGYYIEVTGIGAGDLGTTQTVTVDGATYTFSALSLAKTVIEGDYGVDFQNLMKALVLYEAAATAL